eukprot:COSAG05_NODE_152_length_15898_cov_21.995000_5_plen_81_part_00
MGAVSVATCTHVQDSTVARYRARQRCWVTGSGTTDFGRCAMPRAARTSGAERATGLWLRRAQCMNISKRQSGPIVPVSPR